MNYICEINGLKCNLKPVIDIAKKDKRKIHKSLKMATHLDDLRCAALIFMIHDIGDIPKYFNEELYIEHVRRQSHKHNKMFHKFNPFKK